MSCSLDILCHVYWFYRTLLLSLVLLSVCHVLVRHHVLVLTLNRYETSALVVAADILIKELDVKVLVGCTEEEVDQVLRFLNQTNYQKTVLIRKGNELPS